MKQASDMNLEKLLESLSYGERLKIYRLLRTEFEEPSPKRDKDLTVNEWLAEVPRERIPTRLYHCLKVVGEEPIANIGMGNVGIGQQLYKKLVKLRGY